jgi:pyruvate/2-oxoglutarate dehydrogenase complex dihydrolipoamide acyltransferase (E2) component
MAEVFEVAIPHAGTVENVEITAWVVSVGDVVSEGDVLADVSTDKADTELEAPRGGKVAKLLVEEEAEVKVGTVVALLVEEDASDEDMAAAVAAHTTSGD